MTVNSFEKQAKSDEFRVFMEKNYPIANDEKSLESDDDDQHSDLEGTNKKMLH